MFAAVTRLAAITLAVLILTVLAVVFVRWVGGHQQFHQPPHAWFEQDTWTMVVTPVSEMCATPPAAEDNRIFILPVINGGKEAGWQVPCDGKPKALGDFLAGTSHADWVIFIEAKDTPDLDQLIETLSGFDKDKRFAIHAPAQKVARYIRQKGPQWLYAADTASLLRLHFFASLYMAPAMEFWPDFVIASENREDGSHLTEREASELRRRNKRIVWKSEHSGAKPVYDVDGTMTPSK